MAGTLKAEGLTDGVNPIDIQRAIIASPHAYVVMDTVATPIEIKSQYNISSVTDNGVGNYTLNFAQELPSDKYYVVGGTLSDNNNAAGTIVHAVSGAYNSGALNKTRKAVTVLQWARRTILDSKEMYILIGGQ